jgi:hypothetical protein
MATIKELTAAVGGLSKPSKMPGLSYGTPAKDCPIGSILRNVKDSVCSKCYAHKGMYVFPNVREAQARRLKILSSNLADWTENMTLLLQAKYKRKTGSDRVFRWHDSGDIQDAEHLSAIVQIAKNLPDILFWLPTKEYQTVRSFEGEIPSNLVIRVSAPMIGETLPDIPGTVRSTVGAGTGYACPAYSQGGHCGDCRACWDKNVKSVDYPQH